MSVLTPWTQRVQPFRMVGNLYFVGVRSASTHLIDTGEGLLIIDPGYPQTLYLVLENIRALGFDPQHIRWIVHSHGHYDHLGATRALAELTGARTYIAEPDAPLSTGERDLTWARELGYVYHEAFNPDVLVRGEEALRFGNTRMRLIPAPGHTMGTLLLLWNVEGYHRPLSAAMHGGVGLNSMSKAWLEANDLPLSVRTEHLSGLERFRSVAVDVTVGNHADQNHTFEKAAQLDEAANPFVDPGEWPRFIDGCIHRMHEMLRMEREETP